jgi:hypothetical protein
MIGHGAKALRLAPVRLDDGMDAGRKLSHFAHQPLEGSCGGWTEYLHELPRHARRAAGQEREAGADNAKAGEERTDS